MDCKYLFVKEECLRDLTDPNVLPLIVRVNVCQLFKKKVNKERDCKDCKLKYCV